MSPLVSRLFLVAAIALLVWAVVQIALSGSGKPAQVALFIEEPEQELGQLPIGAHTVAFRVRNTTLQPQRIVGMAEG